MKVIENSKYHMTLTHWVENDFLYMQSVLEKQDGNYKEGWTVQQGYEFGRCDREGVHYDRTPYCWEEDLTFSIEYGVDLTIDSDDGPEISQKCKKIVEESGNTRYFDEWEDNKTCPWETDDTKWKYDQTTVTAVVKRSLENFKVIDMGDSLPFTATCRVNGAGYKSEDRENLIVGGSLIDEILDNTTDDYDTDGATTIAFCTSILLSAMVIAY